MGRSEKAGGRLACKRAGLRLYTSRGTEGTIITSLISIVFCKQQRAVVSCGV